MAGDVTRASGAHQPWDDPHVIQDLVNRISELIRVRDLENRIDIGQEVIERFFGSITEYRKRRNKRTSLRKLAAHPELPLSKSALYGCVALYELSTRADVLHRPEHHLSISHCLAVLPASESAQIALLERANQKRWSVRRLREEAASRPANGRQGGRPRTPQVVRAIHHLERYLGPDADKAFAEVDAIQSTGDVEKLLESVRVMKSQMSRVEQKLKRRLDHSVVGISAQSPPNALEASADDEIRSTTAGSADLPPESHPSQTKETPVPSVTSIRSHAVEGDGPVTVTARLGFGQPGHINVYLGTELKAASSETISGLALGSANSLKGQRLVMSAVVLDVQPGTDMTRAVLSLSGGSNDLTIDKEKEAGTGGVVRFWYVVNFK